MQGQRGSLGHSSEALNYEHGSTTSSNGLLGIWVNRNANPESNSVFRHQEDPHRFNINESSSSLNEQRRNDVVDVDQLFVVEDNDPSRARSGTWTRASQPGSSVEGSRTSGRRKAIENITGQSSSRGNRDFQRGESSSSTPASSGPVVSDTRNIASQPSRYSEENTVRAGSSVQGQRTSRKRKAIEDIVGQSSSSTWIPTSISRPRNGLNMSGSRGHVSGPVSAVAESSSRNTSNHPSAFPAGTFLRRNVGPPQSHVSRNVLADSRHGQNVVSWNLNASATNIPSVTRNMLPPFEGSSNSTVPNERNHHLDETRSENILEIPMFMPAPVLGDPSRNPNVSSNLSRTGSTTNVQPPFSNPQLRTYPNLPIIQRRRSEIVRRPLATSEPPTLPSLASLASPDWLMIQPGDVNSQIDNRASPRARPWFDREGDSVVEFSNPSSRARSGLLMSEIESIFDEFRSDINNNQQSEDNMFQPMLESAATGTDDQYGDMRLDVDNMSYEELCELVEQIGDVCTGVNEATISKLLKLRKCKRSKRCTQDVERCSICLDEYTKGEDIGTLECGHEFHGQCIKEWLKQKNLCPICKSTGLSAAKKRRIRG